jgi:NAD+ synthase
MTHTLEPIAALDPISSVLCIDVEATTARIADALQSLLGDVFRRRGLVIAMSGGIDSSVCAGLAVRALGADHVFGLMLPERDSSAESLPLAKEWAEQLGIEYAVEDISDVLHAAGCYSRRDDAIRRVVPDFGPGWRCKIALAGARLDTNRLNVFSLVVQRPDGALERHRLPPAEYRQIVAATNFKQRIRKMLEYYHADRLHYAVIGTPNRLEYDQGFFVKGGDGLADVKPIAHLYKTQVYAVADYLGVPDAIRCRPPTTDTYSLEQSQEEFYFSLPARVMDAMLFAHNAGWSAETTAAHLGFSAAQVRRAFGEIEQKRSTTRYLHQHSLLVEAIPEIDGSTLRNSSRTRRH